MAVKIQRKTQWLLPILLPLLCATVSASPLVIAHRGASGYHPEHTLQAYAAAIEMGADFIEPDLVLSADGVIFCRHDIYLGSTTDIRQRAEFSDRQKIVNGREEWYVDAFSAEEIKRLRAVQAFRGRSTAEDGKYAIPTLAEVIALVLRKQRETGRRIGIYPELKSPAYFVGQDMAALLLEQLGTLAQTDALPIIIQSFDPAVLQRLDTLTDIPLAMLVTPLSTEQPYTPNVPLEQIAAFADGVGAAKALLLDNGIDSGFVARAHRLQLFVHGWTFRDDAVPKAFESVEVELEHYLATGMDGFFIDFPDTGIRVRDAYRNGNVISTHSYHHQALHQPASRSSRKDLAASPPPNPVRLPSAPITR